MPLTSAAAQKLKQRGSQIAPACFRRQFQTVNAPRAGLALANKDSRCHLGCYRRESRHERQQWAKPRLKLFSFKETLGFGLRRSTVKGSWPRLNHLFWPIVNISWKCLPFITLSCFVHNNKGGLSAALLGRGNKASMRGGLLAQCLVFCVLPCISLNVCWLWLKLSLTSSRQVWPEATWL